VGHRGDTAHVSTPSGIYAFRTSGKRTSGVVFGSGNYLGYQNEVGTEQQALVLAFDHRNFHNSPSADFFVSVDLRVGSIIFDFPLLSC